MTNRPHRRGSAVHHEWGREYFPCAAATIGAFQTEMFSDPFLAAILVLVISSA